MNKWHASDDNKRQASYRRQGKPAVREHLAERPEKQTEPSGDRKNQQKIENHQRRYTEDDEILRAPLFGIAVIVPVPVNRPAAEQVTGCCRERREMFPTPLARIQKPLNRKDRLIGNTKAEEQKEKPEKNPQTSRDQCHQRSP